MNYIFGSNAVRKFPYISSNRQNLKIIIVNLLTILDHYHYIELYRKPRHKGHLFILTLYLFSRRCA